MKVFQRLAHAFVAEGVKHTFGMMGDGNMFWLHELHGLGVKVHEVRHEGAGLGMADGYARTTNDVGVATATSGPGTTQLATALMTAVYARSPIVAFCGDFPVSDQEYQQRFEQAPFAAACETAYVRIHTADYADEAVRKAFFIARSERRPVMLSAPMDIQQETWEDDEPYKPSGTLFTPGVVQPNPEVIRRAADLIAKAKKPVIVAGRGAQWAGAGDAILKLGDRIGALVSTSLLARTWLADKTDYHAGIAGSWAYKVSHEYMADADLVIGVGASMNRFTMENGYLFPNAKVIHIDSRMQVLMYGISAADVYMHADGRIGAEELEKELASRNFRNTGYRTPQVMEALKGKAEDNQAFDLDPGTLDPRKANKLLDELLPPSIGVLTGNGVAAGITNMIMTRPRAFAQSGQHFGCIGQMFPAAIGAVVAAGKPTVMTEGDASFMMHLAEFETVVRYDMPLLVIVMNNQALGAEYYKLDSKKMNVKYSEVSTPDLGKVAVAFGGKGALCRNLDEFQAAVKEWLARPCPMVIDARVSRTVMSIPYRRIQYGMDV